MIRIQTNLPAQETVTEEWRRRVANTFARFMGASDDFDPYPARAAGAAPYFITEDQTWWCYVSDPAGQIVEITCREAAERPGIEFAFASWVVANRAGWRILIGEDPAPKPQKVSAGVYFSVSMPRQCTAEELGTLTFEIPIEAIKVFIDDVVLVGAEVTSYMTGAHVEVVE